MLISCIMPAYNRRDLVPLALQSFLSQDWPDKELVVVDDSPASLYDLFARIPEVTYIRLATRRSIGTKRNMACEAARGECIAHFDSDDWSAPGRLTQQATWLRQSGRMVAGYRSMLFWDTTKQEASKYQGERDYFCGTSMFYRKDYWNGQRFKDRDNGEDVEFWRDVSISHMVTGEVEQMMVARIHGDNTGDYKNRSWPVVDNKQLPIAFFEAMQCA